MNKQIQEMKKQPLIIGVAGGTASGKTSICQIIMEEIGKGQCILLQLDSFYKPLTEEQNKNLKDYNFDHPNALDFELVEECLHRLINGKSTKVPLYDFKTNDRCGEKVVESSPVILFEGILTFYQEQIRNLMDLKIFVNTDDDVRLGRRMLRDIKERGRSIESVIFQYNTNVKKSYDEFIKPTMKHADIIIPRGCGNSVAIECVVNDVKLRMRKLQIESEDKWIISPKIHGKVAATKSFTYFEAETIDKASINKIYEVTNKLLSNAEPSMKNVWIEYLSSKLLQLIMKEEKLLKHPFQIVNDWNNIKKETEIAILLKCTVISKTTLEEINEFFKEMKVAKKLVVASFYSSPKVVESLQENKRLKVYALICNPTATELEDLLLNKSGNYGSLAEEDYYKVFEENLNTMFS